MYKRNFKLLFEDIKVSLTQNITHKQTQHDLFLSKNRKEVIYLYRHMLKNIPSLHTNLLDKRRVYEEIKFNFRDGSRETDYEVINTLKNTCYVIIEKINKGVYPPFPKYKS